MNLLPNMVAQPITQVPEQKEKRRRGSGPSGVPAQPGTLVSCESRPWLLSLEGRRAWTRLAAALTGLQLSEGGNGPLG